MKRCIVLPLLAGLVLACDCNPSIHHGGGELKLAQNSLDFGDACVKPQDPTLKVQPVTRTLTIQNVGNGPLVLTRVEIEAGKAYSTASDWPREVAVAQNYDLSITFLPTKGGTEIAEITVDDDQDKVPPQTAKLVGNGSSVTANPVATLNCPGGKPLQGGGTRNGCYDTFNNKTADNPLIWFADTIAGQSSEVALKFKNDGCATLEVEKVVVKRDPSSPSPDAFDNQPDAVVMVDDNGSPVTGSYAAFSLTGGLAADRPERAIRFRFQPKSTDTFRAMAEIVTNVPGASTIAVKMVGAGVTPSLELCTTFVGGTTGCATPSIQLTCDFTAQNPIPVCTGDFVARNSGQAPFEITAVRLDRGNAQFKIDPVVSLPVTLQASGANSQALRVVYTPSTSFNYDILSVVSGGGTKQAVVQGGSPPRLEIVQPAGDLADDVDFNKDAAGGSVQLPNSYSGTKTFRIKNAGRGDMKVFKVFFRETTSQTWPAGAPQPIFSVAPPASGTVVAANGGTADVKVTFTDPPNGGPNSNAARFDADLKIETDDPLWPPPNSLKTVMVHGKTPCNPNPIAVVTGPSTGQTKETTVTLSGDTSYDFKPDSAGACAVQCTQTPPVSGCPANPIRKYEWKLQTVPATAGPNVKLVPSGVTTSATTQLTLGACAPCSYAVRLWVYDDTPATTANPDGLRSNYSDFTINVSQ